MRIRTMMLALGLTFGALVTVPALAAAPKAMTPQQQKMADCAHQSKGMKGDAHKQFMSNCLHGKTTAATSAATKTATTAKTTQQEKMKTCSAEAKTKSLKGADRKSFMSTCLKG